MNGQRSSEPAESPPSAGGRAGSARTPEALDIGATAGRKNLNHFSRGDVAHETTRYLAAATQVDLGYARMVRHLIISDPFHALAPVYGADPGGDRMLGAERSSTQIPARRRAGDDVHRQRCGFPDPVDQAATAHLDSGFRDHIADRRGRRGQQGEIPDPADSAHAHAA